MKNHKGFGRMTEGDYKSKLHQLKVSHLMQCVDLTTAFHGQENDDRTRKHYRDTITRFLEVNPNGSFVEYCETLGRVMVDMGAMSQQDFDDILDKKPLDD